MGANQSKVNACYLPAQSGKTRKMNEEIIRKKLIPNEIYNDNGNVNFIISGNNLILVEQTKQRVESSLQQQFDTDVYTWRSGKKDKNGKTVKTHSAKDLAWDILNGDTDTIVMCSNSPRMKQCYETIEFLQKSTHFDKNINIWIDEADASIRLWKKYERIIKFSKVTHITFVSATFDHIFKEYGRLYVLGYEHTHPECYRGLSNCTKVEVDIATTAVEYVKYIVARYELSKSGVRAFIPGDTTQESHNAIASYLVGEGFVVVIINGVRKEILIPGKPSIDLKPYIYSLDEISITVSKIYHENGWDQMPFAITGRNCIERGVTFQRLPDETHRGFLFTVGIISHITDESTAYQVTARVFGNIGSHPDYVPSCIYSTHSMFKKVEKQESCAIHLAKMVQDRSDGMRGIEVGSEEVTTAKNVTTNATRAHQVFITQEDAIAFIKQTFGKRCNKHSAVAPVELLINGENPTVEYVIKRWWGISFKNKHRMIPVVEGWIVYWIV